MSEARDALQRARAGTESGQSIQRQSSYEETAASPPAELAMTPVQQHTSGGRALTTAITMPESEEEMDNNEHTHLLDELLPTVSLCRIAGRQHVRCPRGLVDKASDF